MDTASRMGLNIISWLLAWSLSGTALAEEVEVYRCASKSVGVNWGKPDEEDNTTVLHLSRLGKKVGIISTGDREFPAIVTAAKKHVESNAMNDPFYGPGFSYLIKDPRGQFYIAYFEYVKGDPTFCGVRVALNDVKPVGNLPNVFEGAVHDGSSFDKELVGQLRDLTEKLLETGEIKAR